MGYCLDPQGAYSLLGKTVHLILHKVLPELLGVGGWIQRGFQLELMPEQNLEDQWC